MSLSAKNGWYDEQGRVYIYYTLDEIQEDLNCGHDKATRMLVELDNGKNGFVKNIFGFRKAVYRGLRKNLNRLHVLFASANLYMLARAGGSLCPA